MTIAIIVRRLDRLAGVERHALNFARALMARSHRVVLYTFHYGDGETFKEAEGLRIVALNPREGRITKLLAPVPLLSSLVRYREDLSHALSLARMIERDTEILNPHDQAVYRVAAYYKKLVRNIPSVWSMHDMPTRTFARMREEECGGRARGVLGRLLDILIDRIEIWRFIKPQDAITVLDERDRKWSEEYFDKEAVVTHSAVDPSLFAFRARTQTNTPLRLLMTGIFFPHRRFEDGIEALARLQDRGIDTRLTIIGSYKEENSYAKKIKHLIREHALEGAVTLRGRVSEDELRRSYHEADVFLFPNHLQSWGIAVFEALASGVPVVVSSSAGAAEVLTDRETGLIVPPKNPTALAQAIETLARERELYSSLSRAARALVERELTWEKLALRMEHIFTHARTS